MDARAVRRSLSSLGVNVNVGEAFNLMQRYTQTDAITTTISEEVFSKILEAEFRIDASRPRSARSRLPVSSSDTGLASASGATPAEPSGSAPRVLSARELTGGDAAVGALDDGLDPMGAPAPTTDGIRRQIGELERAQRELQRRTQGIIAGNGQQLGVLHAQLDGLRSKLAAQQQQPVPVQPVPTVVEEEQLQAAEFEVHELRRRRDATRAVKRERQAQLQEAELEVQELLHAVRGVARAEQQRGSIRAERVLLPASASRLGGPSHAEATPAEHELVHAAAEERLETARDAQRTHEHMANRLRKQRVEFDARFERAQQHAARERKKLEHLRIQLAEASQRQRESEEKLRQVERSTALRQTVERADLSSHESALASTQAAVMQLELSRMTRSSQGKLTGLATSLLESPAKGGGGGGGGGGDGWVSEAQAQQAAWERVKKKTGIRQPVEVLRQAQAQQAVSLNLAGLLGKAREQLGEMYNERNELEASKARLHAAAVSAADKRLGQLREAVTDAEAELARVAERHKPAVDALRSVRKSVGAMLETVPAARRAVGADVADCSSDELAGAVVALAEAIELEEAKAAIAAGARRASRMLRGAQSVNSSADFA